MQSNFCVGLRELAQNWFDECIECEKVPGTKLLHPTKSKKGVKGKRIVTWTAKTQQVWGGEEGGKERRERKGGTWSANNHC